MKNLFLNVKFVNNQVECAKSPSKCKGCSGLDSCEKIRFSYDPFKKGDILECFKNNDRRR